MKARTMCRMQYLARYHSTTVRETGVRKRFEATGPDAIPAMLLKDYAAETAPVLLHFFFFMCYINNIPDLVSSTARLFADDCLLRNINASADADKLQDDIDRLHKWEADWLMEFNPDKC